LRAKLILKDVIDGADDNGTHEFQCRISNGIYIEDALKGRHSSIMGGEFATGQAE